MEESRANPRRSSNWADREVWALLGVWRENWEALRAQRRNRHVYVKMQKELQEAGVERSPADIKVKLKNLSRDYRKEKIKVDSGSSPSSWKFYHQIHALLGFLPVNNDQMMQESATLEIMTQDVEEKAEITDFKEEPPEESELPICSTPSLGLDSGNDSSSLECSNAPSWRSRKRKPQSENERNQIIQVTLEDIKANKRNTNWTDSEVLALIGVWRENLEGLRAQRRNSHVYVKMQNELKEAGVERSPADIKVKLKNLSRDYRKEKIKVDSGSSPSSWKFYHQIHALLGFLPVNNDQMMQESATLEIVTQDVEEKAEITDFKEEPPEESELPICSTPSLGLDSGNDSSSLECSNAPSWRSRKRKPQSENERNQIIQVTLEDIKANKRNTNWTDSEVLALIGVWRENLEGLRAQRRNSHVYVKMQNELKEAGVERSPADIKVKLKNLSRDYRKEKIKVDSGSSPSSWKFYHQIHALLGFLPVNNDQMMQESATLEIVTQDVEEKTLITDFKEEPPEESEFPLCSSPSLGLDSGNDSSSLECSNASSWRSRKRKPQSENEINQIMQEMLEESKRHNKVAEEMDQKLVALMERQAEAQAEAQDKIMQILGQMTDILHKTVK